MALLEDVRPLGTELERSYEAYVRGRLKFRVQQIVYVAFSLDETVMGFAFPREERAALVAGEPHKFQMPPAVGGVTNLRSASPAGTASIPVPGVGSELCHPNLDEIVLSVGQLIVCRGPDPVAEHRRARNEITLPVGVMVAGFPRVRPAHRPTTTMPASLLGQVVSCTYPGTELFDVDLTTHIGVLIGSGDVSAP